MFTTRLIIHVKVFPYDLTHSHNTSVTVRRRTDRRQRTTVL